MTAPTLLRIDSSVRTASSISRRLTDLAVTTWQRTHPAGNVVIRDLTDTPPPHFDSTADTARRRADLTPAEQRSAALADEYAAELRDVDALVLGMPLYNWGPPSTVKAWFDHVIASPLSRDTQTFAPLLEVHPAVLIVARGGAYGDDTPRAGWDHATDWAVKSFTAIGIDLTVVPVEMTLAPGAPYLSEFEHIYHRDLAEAEQRLDHVWSQDQLSRI